MHCHAHKLLLLVILGCALFDAHGHEDAWSRLERSHDEFLDTRRAEFKKLRDPFRIPPKAHVVVEDPEPWWTEEKPWRRGITATVFWVGEDASENNPVHNHASSWDPNWMQNFGGVDDPINRSGYRPAAFMPKLNPFYIALPYNDIAKGGGKHKPEAQDVIQWYWRSFKSPSSSVCKGRWIAIHCRGEICYAQWEDAGPFSTDDWLYVFEGQRPMKNRNQNAGIDVSPAVRDFLGIRSGEKVDWKFVEDGQVPHGPWVV